MAEEPYPIRSIKVARRSVLWKSGKITSMHQDKLASGWRGWLETKRRGQWGCSGEACRDLAPPLRQAPRCTEKSLPPLRQALRNAFLGVSPPLGGPMERFLVFSPPSAKPTKVVSTYLTPLRQGLGGASDLACPPSGRPLAKVGRSFDPLDEALRRGCERGSPPRGVLPRPFGAAWTPSRRHPRKVGSPPCGLCRAWAEKKKKK